MSIRTLFLLLAAATALLLASLATWQIRDSQAKVQAVDWLELSNQLVDNSQQAAIDLAVERGLSARLLANNQPSDPAQWELLKAQRGRIDQQLAALARLLSVLEQVAPQQSIERYKMQLMQVQRQLHEARLKITPFTQRGARPYKPEQWIELSTGLIEQLRDLSSLSLVPLPENIYSYAAQPVLKDLLFSLSEELGRERALLSTVLAQSTPLTAEEEQQLTLLQNTRLQLNKRLQLSLQPLAERPAIKQAISDQQSQLGHYQNLRAQLLTSKRNAQPYPVSVDEWFAEATQTIASVQQLSRTLFSGNTQELRRNAEQARNLVWLAILALLVLLGLSLQQLRRRIFNPLKQLIRASKRIAAGELNQPLQLPYNDEIGRLGHNFERMRQQILSDRNQLIEQAQQLHKLTIAFEHSVASMLITDQQGVIEYVNEQFMRTTGYQLDELVGQKAGIWRSGSTDQSNYREMWSTIRLGKVWMGELLNKRKNGELYWALVSISPVRNEQGQISHYINMSLDISEHKRIAERLDFVSYYDQTTSLPNRQQLARHFVQLGQHSGQLPPALALVSLSIGRLKHINDSLGWAVGDKALREVGRRLKECAGPQDIVAHQEGGHFSVLLYPLDSREEALARATQMVKALHKPLLLQQQQIQLQPRAGISLLSVGADFETLQKNADLALHHAEQSPTERVHLYSHELDLNAQQRVAMESALRWAIEQNGLELHYQPKVEILSGRILGVEALARWKDSRTGLYVSPQLFIGIAEESGLIHALGDWVLQAACRQARTWLSEGFELGMAVNVSAEQLKQNGFAERVATVLKESGLIPGQLELELTESVLMEHPEHTIAILQRFKKLGIKLAIDDFGTGYSSLAYLSRLPVDHLKIDRSFVDQLTREPRAAAIATSVIALGQRMGLKVIAEGVEDEAQLRYLAQHQCDEIQGYYFSKPLPAEALNSLLRRPQAPLLNAPALEARRL